MQEFQIESTTEPVFDDKAQGEIIALAARLQREAGQSMSLSELERVAMEAGIDPRFVREAAIQRAKEVHPLPAERGKSIELGRLVGASLAITLVQATLLWIVMMPGPKTAAALAGLFASIGLGWIASRFGRQGSQVWIVPILATLLSLVSFSVGGSQVFQWADKLGLVSFVALQSFVAYCVVQLSKIRISVTSKQENASHG